MHSFSGSRRRGFYWKKVLLTQDALKGMNIAVIGGTNGIGQRNPVQPLVSRYCTDCCVACSA